MNDTSIKALLEEVKAGRLAIDQAVDSLKDVPSEIIDFVNLDHSRQARTAIPEVIFGENKDASQIVEIAERMLRHSYAVMATRVDSKKGAEVCRALPELIYHPQARMLTGNQDKVEENQGRGTIGVLSAGTSDIPVAEEACLTAVSLGHKVERAFDVGVAGLHRLFSQKSLLDSATVLIVVAGMEGALPSVVAGLVKAPVVAVPTSIGYGTGFGGMAALLAMLNSCAPGVAVVNIDNGFGAGCMAAAINRK